MHFVGHCRDSTVRIKNVESLILLLLFFFKQIRQKSVKDRLKM